MSRTVPVALLLALLLAGCGSSSGSAQPPTEEPAPLDCGRYENRNEPPSDAEADAHRCILDAFSAGELARLAFSRLTVEGDPIEYGVTVVGAGEVEVVVDNREDAFADGAVRQSRCTTLRERAGFLEWDGCKETP